MRWETSQSRCPHECSPSPRYKGHPDEGRWAHLSSWEEGMRLIEQGVVVVDRDNDSVVAIERGEVSGHTITYQGASTNDAYHTLENPSAFLYRLPEVSQAEVDEVIASILGVIADAPSVER